MSKAKTCFVIGPIGKEESAERRRADNVLKHIIRPALETYEVVRSDEIEKTGRITTQIVQHVRDADLVVADVSDLNPNVFYELALRHVTNKPVIVLKAPGQPLPFDISQDRAIDVDPTDLESAAECRRRITAQAKAAEDDPRAGSDNPVAGALRFQAVETVESGSILRGILTNLEQLRAELISYRSEPERVLPQNMARLGPLPGIGRIAMGSDAPPVCYECGRPIRGVVEHHSSLGPRHAGGNCPELFDNLRQSTTDEGVDDRFAV